MRWEVNGDDPPFEMEESEESDSNEEIPAGDDDGMSAEDRSMDVELLHEKWENTPYRLVPLGVRHRLWMELSVHLAQEQAMEKKCGWNIELWSARKRRRLQVLARAAVYEEMTVCAMRCVCASSPSTR